MHTNGYSLRSVGTNKSGQADVQTELTPTRRRMIAAGLQTGRISDQETLSIPVTAANAEVDVDMLRRPPRSDLSPPLPLVHNCRPKVWIAVGVASGALSGRSRQPFSLQPRMPRAGERSRR